MRDLTTMDRRMLLSAMTAAGTAALLPGTAWARKFAPPSRMRGFNDAKFGLFVHFGPYAQKNLEASWPIMTPKADWALPFNWTITEKEYVNLAKTFNPALFDADEFIDAAKSAGQRYIVLGTKHHDGYCMFDSAYTDYKITRSPYGKDITKLLADACARRNMPLGLYYSPPDLHHPGFRDTSKPSTTNWMGQPERPEWASYLDYMELQLSELLTRYGDLFCVWFDGLFEKEKYNGRRFLDLIARLQPDALVNDRIGLPGDFATPEQFIPAGVPTRDVKFENLDRSVQEKMRPDFVPAPENFQPWETNMTMNNTWSYNANDRNFKSSAHLINSLVDIASRGGNFLLNVGPGPDGRIQVEFRERLADIGRWMAVNGEAIYGSTYGPIQGQSAYRTTAKGDDVFLHLLTPPSGSLTLPNFGKKIVDARLLSDKRPLKFRQDDRGIELDLAGVPFDPTITVMRLTTA